MKPKYELVGDGRFDPARVGRSAKATLIGWVFGALASGFVIYSPLAFCYMAPFVISAWVLFVIPHALLVPRSHILTRPWVACLYGALWGLVILWLYQTSHFLNFLVDFSIYNIYCLIGALVTGAVTGLVGARCEP